MLPADFNKEAHIESLCAGQLLIQLVETHFILTTLFFFFWTMNITPADFAPVNL